MNTHRQLEAGERIQIGDQFSPRFDCDFAGQKYYAGQWYNWMVSRETILVQPQHVGFFRRPVTQPISS